MRCSIVFRVVSPGSDNTVVLDLRLKWTYFIPVVGILPGSGFWPLTSHVTLDKLAPSEFPFSIWRWETEDWMGRNVKKIRRLTHGRCLVVERLALAITPPLCVFKLISIPIWLHLIQWPFSSPLHVPHTHTSVPKGGWQCQRFQPTCKIPSWTCLLISLQYLEENALEQKSAGGFEGLLYLEQQTLMQMKLNFAETPTPMMRRCQAWMHCMAPGYRPQALDSRLAGAWLCHLLGVCIWAT